MSRVDVEGHAAVAVLDGVAVAGDPKGCGVDDSPAARDPDRLGAGGKLRVGVGIVPEGSTSLPILTETSANAMTDPGMVVCVDVDSESVSLVAAGRRIVCTTA